VSLGVTTKSQEVVSRLQADSPSTRTFAVDRVEKSALGFSDAIRQAVASRVRNREHYVAGAPARPAQSSGTWRDIKMMNNLITDSFPV
jgi:hypothetical protein